MIDWVW